MGFPVRRVPEDIRRMIDAWLATHGGPRRFQRGESADFFALQRWLLCRGYVLSASKGSFFVRPVGGERQQMKWRQVIELVDTLRAAHGLETIVPMAA